MYCAEIKHHEEALLSPFYFTKRLLYTNIIVYMGPKLSVKVICTIWALEEA